MDELDRLEDKIKKQVDRLNTLVIERRTPQFIMLEYKKFARLVTEQHKLLLDKLIEQKHALGNEMYSRQKTTLMRNYKTYLIAMAQMIDHALARQTAEQ